MMSANVGQVRIAHFRILVVSIHGVNRFREFSAAVFVYTAGIDPDIFEPMSSGQIAATLQLPEADLASGYATMRILDILKYDFLLTPSMRENSIRWDVVSRELGEVQS